MPSLLSFLSRFLGKKEKNKNKNKNKNKTNKSPLSNGETHEAVPRTQRVHPGLTLKPLGIASRIPDDIWREIAQFIPDAELKGLLGINTSLFHLAMDARYRTVVLSCFNDAGLRELRRLRDPAVAPRVRQLRLHMPQRSYRPGLVENHVEHRKVACFAHLEPQDIIKETADTIRCFSSVVDLFICWRYPARAPNEEEVLPFLTVAWNTFGPQLRKIELQASLTQLQTLLCTSGRLDAVEELQLDISSCHPTTQEADVLATAVAPFINRAALNLKSLTIRFDGDLPYPPLFNSLGEIPKLESLTLDIPSNSYGFSEEQGLTRILRNHAATLRHVHWETHHLIDWVCPRSRNLLIEWMKQNQSDETILSNLHTLEILVPAGPVAFGLTMGYIRRSTDTLTSLVLSGAYLTGDQAKTMMSIFTHRRSGPYFQELKMNMECLSPDVVLKIAQIFPCLGKLALFALKVSGSEQNVVRPRNRAEELACARGFAEEMRRVDIRGWQLHDIDYTTFSLDDNSDLELRLMMVFAECVPSIKYFRGVVKEFVPLKTVDYRL